MMSRSPAGSVLATSPPPAVPRLGRPNLDSRYRRTVQQRRRRLQTLAANSCADGSLSRRTMRSFRIVVAGHGDLAAAFASAAQMICGRIPLLTAVGLQPEDSPESFMERLVAAAPDPDEPLLLLTDLVGGTPHNVSLALARRRPSAV